MSILPVAMLALLVATSAAVRGVVTTPAGMALVSVGISLNLVGWQWMRAIIRRAAR
jgi:Flp pilus assembly protein TadB